MARPRAFDHDAAWERYSNGETIARIAASVGVSVTSVRRAVVPGAKKTAAAASSARFKASCSVCGGKCTNNYYTRAARNVVTPLMCRSCSNRSMCASVRDNELRCSTCQEWKPDFEFPSDRNLPHRRGRHAQCRPCGTKQKRAWRAKQTA